MVSRKNWEHMCNLIKKGSDQNSLQILEQDRRETVLVNALAYFLHPRRGGQTLNDKMLKNLFGKTERDYINDDFQKSAGNLFCMTTEFPCYEDLKITDVKPKRIDLFLEFENYCIGIEAKVDSDLKNKLEVYRRNVKKRSKSWRERDFATILLLTERKKKKLLSDNKKYPEDIRDKWPIITWKEITEDCVYSNDNEQKIESLDDLLDALKNIDRDQIEDMRGLIEGTEKLDEKANKLKKEFEELRNEDEKLRKEDITCIIWSGERKIRHIVEPRVVIEYPDGKFKIDVCVGFRGVQFIIFNNRKYKPELYENICNEYPFFYWQDYSDPSEHFDRYLLREPGREQQQTGPLFPDKQFSVKEESTVFYKSHFNDELDDWISEAIIMIKKILRLKDC